MLPEIGRSLLWIKHKDFIVTRITKFAATVQPYIRIIAVCLLSIAVVAALVVHIAFLEHYPIVFIDEPWYANAAWNWGQTGINFSTMHTGTMDQFGYEWIYWPYLGNLPWLISFTALGLGLFQARLVSWLFGLILVLATMFVGRRAFSHFTGLLAALLLVLGAPFTQASHYARPDVMLAAIIMTAFWLALISFEKERWWMHLLTGLVLGLAVDVHQNALMFIPALASLYLITYRFQLLRKQGAWLCAVGGLIGIGYYGLTHIAPNPSVYFTLFDISFGGPHKLPLLALLNPLNIARSFIHEIGRYHFFENTLDFALIGASVSYLAVRRSRSDLRLLSFVILSFICFVLFVGNKHDIYAILFYPFFMLIVAEALVSLFQETRNWRSAQRGFMAALILLLLVSSTVRFLRPLIQNQDYNYYAVTDSLKTVLPSDARVMGLPHWWLGLADYDYRSSLNLTYYNFYNGYGLTEGLEMDRPDYLIVDTALRGLLVDEGYFPPGPGFEIYKLPRQEFEAFLAQRGEKKLEFWDPWHGRFEVYAIRWD
jgi:4-amino-4-deoxy-L-arabinose transferase-like glycosyltransferase